MKIILASFIILLSIFTVQGQESLSAGGSTASPSIDPDGKVTFQLEAPDAARVLVTGDFIPDGIDNRQPVPMVRGEEGIWSHTTGPLESELYYYNFIVDGVRITDPGNVYQMRDVASVMNYFIVDGGPGSKGHYYSANNIPRGSVSKVWYDSPALGFNRRMSVYTPPGYESDGRSYPVFYLLHGAGGDEEAWLSLGRASYILDNLIAEGSAVPMIVVMTNGNPGRQAAPGETAEGLYRPGARGGAPGRSTMEESFPDVIRFVERTYRTLPGKENRAIAGLSMGGGHSYRISMSYPDLFDYVGLFSAASQISPREDSTPEQIEAIESYKSKLAVQFSDPPRLYYIACGDTDFLYPAFDQLTSYFDEMGYPHVKVESDGGHTWRNWRIYLTDFARRVFKSDPNPA